MKKDSATILDWQQSNWRLPRDLLTLGRMHPSSVTVQGAGQREGGPLAPYPNHRTPSPVQPGRRTGRERGGNCGCRLLLEVGHWNGATNNKRYTLFVCIRRAD